MGCRGMSRDDMLEKGTPEDVRRLYQALEEPARAKRGVEDKHAHRAPRIYLAVIGVYTDVKVNKTLLVGLRTRYDIDNLAISNSLTASPTTERHLAALDFAARILWADVIHGLNELVHFLGSDTKSGGAEITTS